MNVNIAIIGAGVAGAYLGSILKKTGYNIRIFEWHNRKDHWPMCAWAAPRSALSDFSRRAGLNFDEYIIHRGKSITMKNSNIVKCVDTNVVTFDQQRWANDLLKGVDVTYGVRCSATNFPLSRYDYVVDCSGIHRTLLPKPKEDFIVPSEGYLVKDVNDVDDFYIINYENSRGYFWYFPLGNGKGYAGSVDLEKKYSGIRDFFREHPKAYIVNKTGRPIRFAPPKNMEPFFHGNIIGVGESIGCVFPITGEGVAPTLSCCQVFLDILLDGDSPFDYKKYREEVIEKFRHYEYAYKIMRLFMDNKLNTLFTKSIGDLKLVLKNDLKLAPSMKIAADNVELFSRIFDVSSSLEYPINDLVELYEKLKEQQVVATNEENIFKFLLVAFIPLGCFPIINKNHLEGLTIGAFINICQGMGRAAADELEYNSN